MILEGLIGAALGAGIAIALIGYVFLVCMAERSCGLMGEGVEWRLSKRNGPTRWRPTRLEKSRMGLDGSGRSNFTPVTPPASILDISVPRSGDSMDEPRRMDSHRQSFNTRAGNPISTRVVMLWALSRPDNPAVACRPRPVSVTR
jgi:hypothetical protein